MTPPARGQPYRIGRHASTEESDRSVALCAALPDAPISECNEFITSPWGTFLPQKFPDPYFQVTCAPLIPDIAVTGWISRPGYTESPFTVEDGFPRRPDPQPAQTDAATGVFRPPVAAPDPYSLVPDT
ncbi:hypothetical protein Rhow_003643 [Rhodococcus wratislaviensis]|uniref:Uncharacterized protein n=1 Tax=Rhodococcus wratislaviensis TaxID=44752 RepID=A0A402C8S1_RHOWR|nr:hypothetical protein Rhow_003643 [Rhodococcus wratislaviensis]